METGVNYTPLQDKERTGAIAIFAFNRTESADSEYMRAWVCKDLHEENYLEQKFGEIEPQSQYFERGDIIFEGISSLVHVKEEEYPDEWKKSFSFRLSDNKLPIRKAVPLGFRS